MEEGMGGGRRKRETTEIKTRELLASSLVSPFSLQLPISLPLSLSPSSLPLSFFLFHVMSPRQKQKSVICRY